MSMPFKTPTHFNPFIVVQTACVSRKFTLKVTAWLGHVSRDLFLGVCFLSGPGVETTMMIIPSPSPGRLRTYATLLSVSVGF